MLMLQIEEPIIPEFITVIIIFISGIYATRWYARKKEWDDSLLTAFIVSIIWLISPISIFVLFMFGANYLIGYLVLVITIIIETVIVKIVYKKESGESFVFVIVVLFILSLMGILIEIILEVIIALVLLIFYSNH